MQVKIEKLPKSRVKLSIVVPKDKVKPFFEQALTELSKDVEIPGFRPGKAPKLMMLEKIGHGRLYQETLDKVLMHSYADAVKNEKLVPLHQPAVSITDFGEDKDFSYTAEVDILPEFTLGDYKNLKVKSKLKLDDIKADDKEIKSVLVHFQKQSAGFKDITRGAENGDRIEVDFEGSVNNVKQDSLTSKNYPVILGEGALMPEFEKKLIGAKAGEEKEFSIEVPSQTDQGKKAKADFKVKVHSIKEVILPELNEEFAKKFEKKSIEELKKAISDDIIKEKQAQEKAKVEQSVIDEMVNKLGNFEIPETLITEEVNHRIEDMKKRFGENFDKLLAQTKKTMDDLRKEYTLISEKAIKTSFLLGEIARAEGFIAKNIDPHDKNAQQEITKKTINKLVEIATK